MTPYLRRFAPHDCTHQSRQGGVRCVRQLAAATVLGLFAVTGGATGQELVPPQPLPPISTLPDQSAASPPPAAATVERSTPAPFPERDRGTPSSAASDLRRLQQIREERIQALQRRLEMLAEQQAHPPAPLAPEPIAPDPWLPEEAAAAPAPSVASEVSSTEQPQSLAAVSKAPTLAPIESLIDRIGLADSLLAVGDVQAAYEIYTVVASGKLDAEREAWVLFQLAACDRRSGRIESAQQRYRTLVARKEPQWLAELSRWWLTTIDDRQRLTTNSARLTEITKQLEQEVTRELDIDPRTTTGVDAAVNR